jgi:PAS domain S-box-containing protein
MPSNRKNLDELSPVQRRVHEFLYGELERNVRWLANQLKNPYPTLHGKLYINKTIDADTLGEIVNVFRRHKPGVTLEQFLYGTPGGERPAPDLPNAAELAQDTLNGGEMFKEIVERSPTAVMIFVDNVRVYANQACSDIIGIPLKDLIGTGWLMEEFIHPADVDMVKQAVARVSEEAKAPWIRFRYHKAGRTAYEWAEASGVAIPYGKGNALILFVREADISDMLERISREAGRDFRSAVMETYKRMTEGE